MRKKTTLTKLFSKKRKNVPITMMTAYDYSSAMLVESAEMDMILVGDSLAMVMMGLDTTVAVDIDTMLYHCKMVSRGASSPFLVGDMPFMSYQVSIEESVRNAGRYLKEAGMDAIKLEGGRDRVDVVKAITAAGIPVVGHLGFTPQTISKLGGYRIQGKSADTATTMYEDSLMLQEAGCFAIVYEMVPAEVATLISQKLTIPTIGIGAGNGCDGQVLVYHDMLGLYDRLHPRFVKEFATVGSTITEALGNYRDEVKARTFPAEEHTYPIDPDALAEFKARIEKDA